MRLHPKQQPKQTHNAKAFQRRLYRLVFYVYSPIDPIVFCFFVFFLSPHEKNATYSRQERGGGGRFVSIRVSSSPRMTSSCVGHHVSRSRASPPPPSPAAAFRSRLSQQLFDDETSSKQIMARGMPTRATIPQPLLSHATRATQ